MAAALWTSLQLLESCPHGCALTAVGIVLLEWAHRSAAELRRSTVNRAWRGFFRRWRLALGTAGWVDATRRLTCAMDSRQLAWPQANSTSAVTGLAYSPVGENLALV